MMHNLTIGADGLSPWTKKFGEDFSGESIPFGCGVFFLPVPTKYKNSKAAPNMTYGIFLGYRLAPVSRWDKQYIVADLEDFVGLSSHIDAPGSQYRLRPHITEQVHLGDRGVCSPFKKAYDTTNMTLEGRRSAR